MYPIYKAGLGEARLGEARLGKAGRGEAWFFINIKEIYENN